MKTIEQNKEEYGEAISLLKKGYSKCVDWYLFGILFYEMHFGNSPFLSENKDDLFKNWHNDRYLKQCFFNLQEKFDCDGIGLIEWEKIADFIEKYEWR